jgi:hypothetical protein
MPKKKPGRPKGSRNKKKEGILGPAMLLDAARQAPEKNIDKAKPQPLECTWVEQAERNLLLEAIQENTKAIKEGFAYFKELMEKNGYFT